MLLTDPPNGLHYKTKDALKIQNDSKDDGFSTFRIALQPLTRS